MKVFIKGGDSRLECRTDAKAVQELHWDLQRDFSALGLSPTVVSLI